MDVWPDVPNAPADLPVSSNVEAARATMPQASSTPRVSQHSRATFPLTSVMKTLLGVIKDALVSGEDVTLPSFGTFKVEDHPARTGRNPRTGETIQIPACSRVHFKMTGQLRQLLNRGQ